MDNNSNNNPFALEPLKDRICQPTAGLTSACPKGAFTPVEHSLRIFENVLKRSRTFANMHEGLLFTPPEPHLRAVVLKHSTLFPPWHPGYQNFPFVLRR